MGGNSFNHTVLSILLIQCTTDCREAVLCNPEQDLYPVLTVYGLMLFLAVLSGKNRKSYRQVLSGIIHLFFCKNLSAVNSYSCYSYKLLSIFL